MRTWSLVVVLGFLAGCVSQQRTDTHTIAATSHVGSVAGRPTLGHPIAIPEQPTLMVPFAVESEKGLFERDDPYQRSGYAVSAPPYYSRASSLDSLLKPAAQQMSVRWHNAIFRDLKTGEQWPLLSQRGVIGSWEILGVQPKHDEPFQTRGLLFIAVLDDTNKDGLLDDRDARVAILTDPNGRHPRFLTPADAQVWSVSYDPEKDLIFFQIVPDTNHDERFTFDDVPEQYMATSGSQKPAEPVVGPEVREQVERLMQALPPPSPAAPAH